MNKKTFIYILITLFSLPILLHVYNPPMKLEVVGLVIGSIGYFISPILIFGTLIWLIYKSTKNNE